MGIVAMTPEGTKKIVSEMLNAVRKDYLADLQRLEQETGTKIKSFLALQGAFAVEVKKRDDMWKDAQSVESKLKMAIVSIMALQKEIEVLKKDSAGGADIRALRQRIEALEKK